MLRLSSSAWTIVACWMLSSSGSSAFRPALPITSSASMRQATKIGATRSRDILNEFDHILGESSSANFGQKIVSNRRIQLNDERSTILASSTFAAPGIEEENMLAEESAEATTGGDVDPYADIGMDPQMQKLTQVTEQQTTSKRIENKLKSMDLQDIVSTLIIPSIVAFAGIRWGYNKLSSRVGDKAEVTLDTFANELVYHDGDFEEMKLCVSDYGKRLAWLGPGKSDKMIKRYLALYSKKKTVSPQAISSLSYVFSLFKLSEEKAAAVLVSLCRDMGEDKISSAGKLLFFGSRILKSAEGKAALAPIKDMIKGTYRDATVAETLVDTSQRAIGEAAYRAAVQAAGKNQKSLTMGWEVLGLDKETATEIFDEEADVGFQSDRERMYGGQSQKYDKKGRPIDKEGKLTNEEDIKAAEEEDEEDEVELPKSNVYECGECGYTLFIAKGREEKFFGPGFKCPECGAAKSKFQVPSDDDED